MENRNLECMVILEGTYLVSFNKVSLKVAYKEESVCIVILETNVWYSEKYNSKEKSQVFKEKKNPA